MRSGLTSSLDRTIDFDFLKKYKSNFFFVEELHRINNLPSPEEKDGYLDIVYSRKDIQALLSKTKCNGICISIIMKYGFNDHFYLHLIDKNKTCISLYGIENILSQKDITLENFVIKNIYELLILYKTVGLDSDEIYGLAHQDTRGCLFDLNGDKSDIIYNTETPNICEECLSKINQYPLPANFIEEIKQELIKIDKPLIKKVELFIKKYPLLSITITLFSTILINILSNFLWKFFFEK